MFCAWMAFLFDFFTVLVCVFLLFCDRAILGGLKTSVVQESRLWPKDSDRGKSV